ncbi:flagellar FleN [Azoarcus taiwanensis]|uniref:Flagellar FleN n=1 Tax=Azoarcus taiwanensis TaxID=666964 RepID=A0A972FFW4_9RHOO|nr:flagellar FleN [Azoarcus taiwanensis]NMG04592.1 flagellar FleN [Azoarcus taiwanensis]
MIDALEDQAAGLRRLFRRAPPTVVALFATGRHRAVSAVETCYRIAGNDGRLLLLDEVAGDGALDTVLELPTGTDLLAVLGDGVEVGDVVQPMPGLIGRVPVGAAALALPLLDELRRQRVVTALRELHRRAGFVVVHASPDGAGDPSPFVFAAPRRLLVAEASRSGATEAYTLIKRLAAAGAGSLHVAVARARDRRDAGAFFASLDKLVREHVGVPLAWLGEVERDDLSAGLAHEAAESSPREPEAAFLRRLASLAREPRRLATR